MRYSYTLLSLTAALATTALADVKFISPAAGADVASGTITVKWEDSGDSPSLDDLAGFTLDLMVGGNDPSDAASAVAIASLSTKNTHVDGQTSLQGTVPANGAGELENGFYLRMISTGKDGGTVTNFSQRFSMTGMTGTTPAGAAAAAKKVTGTAGPDTINAMANNADAGAAAGGAAGDFDVPYALQSGLTKYAPMQGIPPTKISAKNFKPLHSTSSFKVAMTFLPKATVQTTTTQSQTFHVSSIENTVSLSPCHPV